jgi:hypothetical protein
MNLANRVSPEREIHPQISHPSHSLTENKISGLKMPAADRPSHSPTPIRVQNLHGAAGGKYDSYPVASEDVDLGDPSGHGFTLFCPRTT